MKVSAGLSPTALDRWLSSKAESQLLREQPPNRRPAALRGGHAGGSRLRAQGREASLPGVESGSQASWQVSSGLQAFPVPQAGLANAQACMLDGMTGVAGDPK